MQLRVTRPGFIEGMRALQAARGVADYDVHRDATRQEMRSCVCGRCHVEYYFRGPEKRLVYPWAKGISIDDIMAYYDETGREDWIHAETGAEVLEAQHPSSRCTTRAKPSCAAARPRTPWASTLRPRLPRPRRRWPRPPRHSARQ